MKSRVLLALLPLLACGGGGADVEPKSGVWLYNESELVDNNCGDSVPMYPDGDFTLTVSGAQFTVETPTETFTCSYDGGAFSCPERVVTEYTVGDTKATLKATIDGDLDSSTDLSGVQSATVDCTGSACGIAMTMLSISQFPCAYSISFTASARP